MKPFKFLTNKKPLFGFEMVTQINYSPESLRSGETWSLDRSTLIKEWLSEYFFGSHPNGFDRIKYFPEMDRTCEIIQTGLDSTPFHQRLFTAIIQIKRSNLHFMEVHLYYPIDSVVYS